VLFPNDTPKAVDSLRYNYKTQQAKTYSTCIVPAMAGIKTD